MLDRLHLARTVGRPAEPPCRIGPGRVLESLLLPYIGIIWAAGRAVSSSSMRQAGPKLLYGIYALALPSRARIW